MPAPARFTLSQRLLAMSGVLIVSLGGVVVVVCSLLGDITEEIGVINDNRQPQLLRAASLELHVTQASLHLRHAMLARSAAEKDEALAAVGAKRQAIESEMAMLGKSMITPVGAAAHAAMVPVADKFFEAVVEDVKLIQAGQKAEAFAYLADQLVPARNQLLAQAHGEMARQSAMIHQQSEQVRGASKAVRNVVIGAVGLVLLGLAGFCGYVLRVMRQLGGEVGDLKRVADSVSSGDLAAPIDLRAGDSASILAALKGMAATLARTVRSVRENAESVAMASAEIAGGNADLSSRTEQQASALQQTTASMLQLGQTVQQNAENARLANQMAQSSSAVASKGGAMVREVVDTMKDINDSSRRIGDIIGVIDSIAFQTNILALNAAVEAARAGEQGRGFAVVATEVRSLAHRSADAAREIKQLIGSSVERVEKGTRLVDETGATMREIVASIGRVTDIVGEISAASAEQSSGVAQIGKAVSQMDEATQRNAALVEQSAAAADSLKQQATQMVEAMAVFRLA